MFLRMSKLIKAGKLAGDRLKLVLSLSVLSRVLLFDSTNILVYMFSPPRLARFAS